MKKQTAQRLAQEQHRKVSKSNTSISTSASASAERGGSTSSGGSNQGNQSQRSGGGGFRGRRNKFQADSVNNSHPQNVDTDNAKAVPALILTGQMNQRNLASAESVADTASVASIGSTSFHSIGNQQHNHQSPIPCTNRNTNGNGGFWNNSFTRGVSPSANSGYRKANATVTYPKKNVNKLPHGLTMSELKEMTKARLAAEAGVIHRSQHGQQRQVATPSTATQWAAPSPAGNPMMTHSPQPPTTPVPMMAAAENQYGLSMQQYQRHPRESLIPMSPSTQRTPVMVASNPQQGNQMLYLSSWDAECSPVATTALPVAQSRNTFQQQHQQQNASFFGYNNTTTGVPVSPNGSFMQQHQHQSMTNIKSVPSSNTPPPPPVSKFAIAPSSAPAKSILQRGSSLGGHMPEWVAESVLFTPPGNEFMHKTPVLENGSNAHLSTSVNDFCSSTNRQNDRGNSEGSAFSGVFRDSSDNNGGSYFGGSLSFGAIGDNLSRGSTPRPRIESVGSVGISSDFNSLLRVNEGYEHRETENGRSAQNDNNLFGFLSSP